MEEPEPRLTLVLPGRVPPPSPFPPALAVSLAPKTRIRCGPRAHNSRIYVAYERLIHKTRFARFASFRSALVPGTRRDAGNAGKKGTKPSPQLDKAADVAGAGRKTAGVPGSGAEMAEGNQSPPKAEVDDSSLQHAMDRNKECEYIYILLLRFLPGPLLSPLLLPLPASCRCAL